MGFLAKLFGRGGKRGFRDEHGLLVYVQCDKCGSAVRLRIDKQHDLNRIDGGYRWHKTIVDSKCFRQIPTVATFDSQFNLTKSEMTGGRFITAAEYEKITAPPIADVSAATDGDESVE